MEQDCSRLSGFFASRDQLLLHIVRRVQNYLSYCTVSARAVILKPTARIAKVIKPQGFFLARFDFRGLSL